MRIKVKANLILTIPDPKEGERAGDFVLAAEQHINSLGFAETIDTGTKVGFRIHVSGEEPKVTE